MADKLSDRLRSLARSGRRDYEETGAALILAADALDLAEQHELEHLARHAESADVEAAEDASPEGRLNRILGWGTDSLVIGGAVEAERIVLALSVREFREMLSRLDDSVRAAERAKELAIYTKTRANALLHSKQY